MVLPLFLAVGTISLPVATSTAAAAAPAAAENCPASVADEMAALVTARICGREVAIDGATTPTVLAVALPSGQIRQEISAAPVRVRQNSTWAPVDLTLVRNADGSVTPKAAPSDLVLTGPHTTGAAHTLATVGTGDSRVSVGWTGELREPELDGDTATYREARPGVDLQVKATRAGLETFFVVKHRDAASEVDGLKLPVTGAKVASHRTDADGNTTLLTSAGKAVVTVPAPEMWDSRVDRNTGEPQVVRPVPATITKRAAKVKKPKKAADGAGAQFTLAADESFFDAADTVYPVIVDPQINPLSTTFDTYVKQGDTVDRSGANDLQLGLVSGDVARSFLSWDTTKLAGKQITAATVYFYNFWSHVCTANSWEIWSTASANADTRWTKQPAWNTKEATSTATKGASGCADGWVSISGTSFFQRAATAKASRGYMGVRATSETTANAFKQFRSRNADSSAQVPYASVTYNSYPVVGARSTTPASTCATGTGRPFISSATPALKAVVTDGEGSAIKGVFEWYNSAGTKINGATTASAASGSTVSTTVPSGAFVNGSTYKWRVAGNDGTVGGAWSTFCEFTIDTTVPGAAPTVSGPSAPAVGSAGTFSLGANGVTDAAAFLYGLNTNPPTTAVNATSLGGSATVAITPPTAGTHTLYVRSRDRAGNLSAITAYPFTAESKVGQTTSPHTGDLSAGKVVLAGEGAATSTGATYQWRRGETDAWATIPAADVTKVVGGGAVSWPLPTTGSGRFESLNWNVEATVNAAEAGPDALDGPLLVRAAYTGGTAGNSTPVRFSLDRDRADAPANEMGPGEVNLLTGAYQVTATDADASGFGVTRSFSSRDADLADPLFGPGWNSATEITTAETYRDLTVTGSLAQLADAEGDAIGFTRKATTSTGASFEPEIGSEEYRLEYLSTANAYELTDADGNVTTFGRRTGDPAGLYTPVSAVEFGTGETTSLTWEKVTVNGADVVRPTRVVGPAAAGVTCTSAPLTTPGCRTLTYAYATATAGDDYTGRLKELAFTAYDPATAAMKTVVLARYAYDGTGRLRAAWDPRWDFTELGVLRHAAVTYTYNADGTLSTVTPSGQEPWQLGYTTIPGDAGKGRLSTVSRSALAAGTATSTVVYRVPLSGAGAPADLSAGQAARWGQNVLPVDATAVFPPTQIPGGNQAAGALPTSYTQATVSYLDGNARQVNALLPGYHLSATWYDLWGNEIRDLTPANLERALWASDSDNAGTEATLAANLSSTTVYSADGIRVAEEFGPEHSVDLADWNTVRGRTHTAYKYDEGAPEGSQAYNLVTTETRSVRYFNAAGAATDADHRVTKTEYDWKLLVPTATVEDPDGLALRSTTTYDSATALETSTTTPAGDGTTAATRTTTYYAAGTGSGYDECDSKPQWAGLICRTGPAAEAEVDPELPAQFTEYDMYWNPTVTAEKNSTGTLRTTTVGYDAAGRTGTVTVSAGENLGTPVETRRSVYNPSTGDTLRTEQLDGSGAVIAQVSRVYDSLGRMISYTDADGATSTATFDIASQVKTLNDGKATSTYGYDLAADPRGLATSITDGQIGTFGATYNADGQVETETRPDGVIVYHYYDETGTKTGIQYDQADGTTLYADWAGVDAYGTHKWHADSFSWGGYTYDGTGRLIGADTSTSDAGCTGRGYGYDDNSNRSSQRTYAPAADGSCQWSDPSATRTWEIDSADRIKNGGYAYDDLGRTLTVPSADTEDTAAGDVTLAYYANDMNRSISQGTASSTVNTLDVLAERFRGYRTTTAAGTVERTLHYADDSDSPAWIQEGAGYTRNVRGFAGLAAIYDGTAGQAQWQLSNLRGDVVAVRNGDAAGLTGTFLVDEFGVAPSQPRYGFQGSELRSGDNTGGFVSMGVRLYNPVTGRFLSVDPVYGGNANAYEYCFGDPVNCSDLSGKASYPYGPLLNKAEKKRCKRHKWQCTKYLSVSAWAANNANHNYPEGGKQNAYRHCIWSALLTFTMGHNTAYQWNEAHENGSKSWDSQVDRRNNYWGRGVGDWCRIYFKSYQVVKAKNWACKRCRELVRDGYLDLRGGN